MSRKLWFIAWAWCVLGLAGCSDSGSAKVAQVPPASSADMSSAPPADGAAGVEQAPAEEPAPDASAEEAPVEEPAPDASAEEAPSEDPAAAETGSESAGSESAGGDGSYAIPAEGRQGYQRGYGGNQYDERRQELDASGEPVVRAEYGDAGQGAEEGGDSEAMMGDTGAGGDSAGGMSGFGGPMPGGFGPGGGRGMGPPVPPPPVPLKDLAERQFRSGNERQGMNLLYAQAITGEGDAAQLLQSCGWVPGLFRPVLAERWGVGVVFKPGEKPIEGDDLGVIGPPDDSPGGGGRGGADFGGADSGGGDFGGGEFAAEGGESAGGPTRAEFDKYTGYFGQLLLERLQKQMSAGDFGRPLKAPPAGATAGAGEETPGDFGGGEPAMESDVQPVGPPGLSGGYGVGPPPGRGPGAIGYGNNTGSQDEGATAEPAGGEAGEQGSAAGAAGAVEARPLSRGITLLGVAKSSDKLLEVARQQDLDVLMVVDVAVKLVGRNQSVSNATRVRLIDVRQGKPLYVQRKALVNTEVTGERRKGREPVKDAVDDAFKFVSEKLKLTSLPTKLQAAQAQKRVGALAKEFQAKAAASTGSSKSSPNPLPAMTEMALYHQRGLIDESTLRQGYAALVGDGVAKALTGGDLNQAKRSLAKSLEMDPDQLGPPMEMGGGGGSIAGRAAGLFQGLLRAVIPSMRPSGPMGGPPPGMPPGMGGPPGMDASGPPIDGSSVGDVPGSDVPAGEVPVDDVSSGEEVGSDK
ncbi:MAG: hypothetical protein U0795_15295 [Pirellulales bacterium]